MPRTFSLARLMSGVLIVCLVCGFAVNFPALGAEIAMLALLVAPTATASGLSIYYSRDRAAVLVLCTLGAMLGLLLVPGIGVSFDSWHDFALSYSIVTFPPAICAALLGLVGRI